jgi:hypothetical protein
VPSIEELFELASSVAASERGASFEDNEVGSGVACDVVPAAAAPFACMTRRLSEI